MKFLTILCFSLSLLSPLFGQSLKDARKGHSTQLVRKEKEQEKLVAPPSELFSLVKYPSKVGKLSAYVSKPKDPKKRQPAIIWITGGFPAGGGGEYLWKRSDRSNDQSARQYREAGMIMMYPTFRGANGNPGLVEGFYGEVNDVISAYEYLRKLSYVDPKKIYLGGHSTGATLALLVAETTDKFRGVICIGGIDDPCNYGVERIHYKADDLLERKLRAPIYYLNSVKTPTLAIEGKYGNYDSVVDMKAKTENKKIAFVGVDKADHFNVLYPLNKYLAESLMRNPDALKQIKEKDLQGLFINHTRMQHEANDLRTLARYKSEGIDHTKKHNVRQYLWTEAAVSAQSFYSLAKVAKLNVTEPVEKKVEGGSYWSISVDFTTKFNTLNDAFSMRERVQKVAEKVDALDPNPSTSVWPDGWEILSE